MFVDFQPRHAIKKNTIIRNNILQTGHDWFVNYCDLLNSFLKNKPIFDTPNNNNGKVVYNVETINNQLYKKKNFFIY